MDLGLLATNLLTPPILFFLVGAAAVALRSDLEIPQPLPKLFSLYLLFAIGFRGGVELTHGGFGGRVLPTLAAAIFLSLLVPFVTFYLLRRRIGVHDAAAMAATYGSVSAVTFITAAAFLERLGIPYGGHMVAAMALMESPAIVVGVLLVRLHAAGGGPRPRLGALLHDAFLNGSVFLILSSLVVGAITGDRGRAALAPFTDGIFVGVLTLFLLDMGLIATRRLAGLRQAGLALVAFAVAMPLAGAAVATGLVWALELTLGDGLLLVILGASASYIAVPAALRIAIPEANPGLTLPLALGITFPFNISVGIPLYLAILRWVGAEP